MRLFVSFFPSFHNFFCSTSTPTNQPNHSHGAVPPVIRGFGKTSSLKGPWSWGVLVHFHFSILCSPYGAVSFSLACTVECRAGRGLGKTSSLGYTLTWRKCTVLCVCIIKIIKSSYNLSYGNIFFVSLLLRFYFNSN